MDGGEALLRRHMTEPRFLCGEFDGRWRLFKLEWPFATFGVVAHGGQEFFVRLDCTSYPHRAPTGSFWDTNRNVLLDFTLWPRGGRSVEAFRTDWQHGTALYLPCDHVTLSAHEPNWPRPWPSMLWRSNVGITSYLKVVHDILQDPLCTYVKLEGAAVAMG